MNDDLEMTPGVQTNVRASIGLTDMVEGATNERAGDPVATADFGGGSQRVTGPVAILERMREGFRSERGAAQLKLDGKTIFLVDFSTQHVWHLVAEAIDDRQLGKQFLDYGERLEMVPCQLTPEIIGRLGNRMQPLACLVWDASLSARGRGVTMPMTSRAAVRLRRWPAFQLLVQRHDHFRLCSLLLRKTCTATECMQLLDLDEIEILDFMRAAYFTGCADIEGVRSADPENQPARKAKGSRLVGWWRSMRDTQRVGVSA